jgi:hypothetical protein
MQNFDPTASVHRNSIHFDKERNQSTNARNQVAHSGTSFKQMKQQAKEKK